MRHDLQAEARGEDRLPAGAAQGFCPVGRRSRGAALRTRLLPRLISLSVAGLRLRYRNRMPDEHTRAFSCGLPSESREGGGCKTA